MINYSKLKPIPFVITQENKTFRHERVLIKYDKEDLEKAQKIGRFYLPISMHKTGDYCIEFGTALKLSGYNSTINEGDDIASTYSLLMVENSAATRNIYHLEYLGVDEEGNEYSIPPILPYNVFAKFKGGKIYPLEGQIFCEPPQIETPDKVGLIYIPDTAKKITTDKQPYKTKVLFIHKNDSKKLGVKVGDYILCSKNSDIPITLKGNKYIRVPSDYVLGVFKK